MPRRFVVELEAGAPPSGRVIAADGSSVVFAGWTELAQALEPAAKYAARPDGDEPAADPPSG